MKQKFSKYFLIVSIFTFMAMFIYIVQNSYSNLMKPISDVKSSNLLKPIDPNLDLSVLDNIEKRSFYSPLPSQNLPTPSISTSAP